MSTHADRAFDIARNLTDQKTAGVIFALLAIAAAIRDTK